jgi:glycosyltransferase involved in cell wall biosynthesis
MKKGTTTVSIGIPAYNEEANIKYLLRDLFVQKTSGLSFKKIIVYSDGSTDSTISIIRKLKSKKIQLITGSKRQGISHALNRIVLAANSEILILLNADTRIKDKKFLLKITKPIIECRADIVSTKLAELPPKSIFEKVVYAGMKFKMRYLTNT